MLIKANSSFIPVQYVLQYAEMYANFFTFLSRNKNSCAYGRKQSLALTLIYYDTLPQ